MSAQKVTVSPERAGPSQNCLPATCRFPLTGTTRSNSTGPPASTGTAWAGSGRTAGTGGTSAGSGAGSAGGVRCCGTSANPGLPTHATTTCTEKPNTATVNHQLGPKCQASPGTGQGQHGASCSEFLYLIKADPRAAGARGRPLRRRPAYPDPAPGRAEQHSGTASGPQESPDAPALGETGPDMGEPCRRPWGGRLSGTLVRGLAHGGETSCQQVGAPVCWPCTACRGHTETAGRMRR